MRQGTADHRTKPSVKPKLSAAFLKTFRAQRSAKVAPLEEVRQTTETANWDNDGGQGEVASSGEVVRAIRATFNFRRVLENRIAISDREGEIVLFGTVRDSYEYWLAGYTAACCPGVRKVTNNLVVKALYEEGSDSWIELSILRALLVKANVDRGSISAKVSGGAVTLGGLARNLARKGLIEACAWEIPGVRAVSNEIKIGEGSSVSQASMDDASIVGQVRCALRQNPLTRSVKATVTSSDGFVVVNGIASNEAERSLVATLSQSVSGVKSVTNGVSVKR